MFVITHFFSPALFFIETAPWFLQWDLWVSVFTLLLAVGTIWLALETRGMRKGSDKAMAEMSSHAAASARAAEKSADATRALAVIGQRAWISIKSVYMLRIPLKAISDSGGKPITIPEGNRSGVGAKRRWQFDVAKTDRNRQAESVRSAAKEELPLAEKGVRGKGRQPLSPPQHTVTRSAISAPA